MTFKNIEEPDNVFKDIGGTSFKTLGKKLIDDEHAPWYEHS